MRRTHVFAAAAAAVLFAAAPAGLGPVSPATAQAVTDVLWYQQCSNGETTMLNAWWDWGFSADTQCPAAASGSWYRGLWMTGNGNAGGGSIGHWEADAPSNIAIVMAHAPEMEIYDPSYYYGEFFYWDTGNSGWLTDTGGQASSWPSASGWQSFSPSSYFGWEIACNASTACGNPAFFDVFDLQLEALEYQTPTVNAGPFSGGSNLWYQDGLWIRGSFPIDTEANDPSGVCEMRVLWDGQVVQDSVDPTPNGGVWDQCDPGDAPNSPQYFFQGATVNTTDVTTGSATGVQLALQAHNASYNPSTNAPDWTSAVEYLNIDNSPVGLTLEGPTDAPVTAGTQYLTATATAGASGVGSILCSVDGSPWAPQQLSGAGSQTATAEVPVSGLGSHRVSCYATNNSFDSNGVTASSETRTWGIRIAEPVLGGISFSRVSRRCRRVQKVVTIPARWITVRRGSKQVRVHLPGRTRRRWISSCKVRGSVKQVAHVQHGRSVTVSGWFATADGTPLSHVAARIDTRPDAGPYAWQTANVVTTSSDGTWRITLPAGPSRQIMAFYPGSAATESTTTGVAKELVPATSTLRVVHPVIHVGAFGAVARFEGRLLGGFVPARGATVAVQALDRGLWRTIATVSTDPTGRWQAHYKVTGGPGNYVVRVYVPRQGGYPWESAYSGHATLVIER